MKNITRTTVAAVLAAWLLVVLLGAGVAFAQSPTPAAAAAAPPTNAELAARLADVEAYVTNGTPKTLQSSGPGHNAWMMTSSALVLFMTLPAPGKMAS